MCEHFVARAADPFRLDELWPFVTGLERLGIAGFGWGAAWLRPEGGLGHHLDVRAFRDDPARDAIGAVETTSVIVHLRRPSKLSTLTPRDTQPFLDPVGRFAFSHNGELGNTRDHRRRYEAEGRIHGRADTEVGARWLEDAWRDDRPAAELLAELHDTFGGLANLAVLAAEGTPTVYAGNAENPVFAFRLGRMGVVSTAIYSIDRSLFQLVAPGATERRLVRDRRSVALDPSGAPWDPRSAAVPTA